MSSIVTSVGIVLRGLGLGTLTGGVYGAAVLVFAMLSAPTSDGGTSALQGFAAAFGLAFVIGCVVGVAVAVPVVIGLVFLRTTLTTPARARWASAATATITPALLAAAGFPRQLALGVAVACAVGAAVWARIVVGLPETPA